MLIAIGIGDIHTASADLSAKVHLGLSTKIIRTHRPAPITIYERPKLAKTMLD